MTSSRKKHHLKLHAYGFALVLLLMHMNDRERLFYHVRSGAIRILRTNQRVFGYNLATSMKDNLIPMNLLMNNY